MSVHTYCLTLYTHTVHAYLILLYTHTWSYCTNLSICFCIHDTHTQEPMLTSINVPLNLYLIVSPFILWHLWVSEDKRINICSLFIVVAIWCVVKGPLLSSVSLSCYNFVALYFSPVIPFSFHATASSIKLKNRDHIQLWQNQTIICVVGSTPSLQFPFSQPLIPFLTTVIISYTAIHHEENIHILHHFLNLSPLPIQIPLFSSLYLNYLLLW